MASSPLRGLRTPLHSCAEFVRDEHHWLCKTPEANKSHAGTTAPDPVATDGLIRINSKDPDGNIVEFVERS